MLNKILNLILVLSVVSCDTIIFDITCDNIEGDIDKHIYDSVVSDFQSKLGTINNKDTFIYFTDPHLLGFSNDFSDDVKNTIKSSFIVMKDLYSILPINFCLCGGDWLNRGDTQEMAKQKLLYADFQMKSIFSPYYKLMGNHDINYQGVVSSLDPSRGDLPRDFIDHYYFSETGSAYYSFMTENTQFFILDSGSDWELQMDSYRWEQVRWLAKGLLESESRHIILGMHMFYYYSYVTTPMTEIVVSLSQSFNNHEQFIMGNDVYDYSNTQGKIHAIVSGHSHVDAVDYCNDIPIIRTCSFKESQSFDLCILNYDTYYIDLIRAGSGDNRSVKLAH